MFWKKKKEKATKKIDKLVTGVIIGSAIVSIFWLSKTQKWKEISWGIAKKSRGVFGRLYDLIGKIMWKIIRKHNSQKK